MPPFAEPTRRPDRDPRLARAVRTGLHKSSDNAWQPTASSPSADAMPPSPYAGVEACVFLHLFDGSLWLFAYRTRLLRHRRACSTQSDRKLCVPQSLPAAFQKRLRQIFERTPNLAHIGDAVAAERSVSPRGTLIIAGMPERRSANSGVRTFFGIGLRRPHTGSPGRRGGTTPSGIPILPLSRRRERPSGRASESPVSPRPSPQQDPRFGCPKKDSAATLPWHALYL